MKIVLSIVVFTLSCYLSEAQTTTGTSGNKTEVSGSVKSSSTVKKSKKYKKKKYKRTANNGTRMANPNAPKYRHQDKQFEVTSDGTTLAADTTVNYGNGLNNSNSGTQKRSGERKRQ